MLAVGVGFLVAGLATLANGMVGEASFLQIGPGPFMEFTGGRRHNPGLAQDRVRWSGIATTHVRPTNVQTQIQ